jgi:hypothetical protein
MDPGGHTGLAWGIFDPTASFTDAIAGAADKGSTTIVGEEHDQIRQIAYFWMRFYRGCVQERCMPPENVEFVSEDFVQRPGGSGGKEGQSPIRILWGVEGYRMGRADEFRGRQRSQFKVHAPPMILQHPTLGSGVTSKRLRDYGCWVVGKEHERSAWKHIIVRLGMLQRVPARG